MFNEAPFLMYWPLVIAGIVILIRWKSLNNKIIFFFSGLGVCYAVHIITSLIMYALSAASYQSFNRDVNALPYIIQIVVFMKLAAIAVSITGVILLSGRFIKKKV